MSGMAQGLRVYVVDDDEKLRTTLRKGLEESGHTCESAGDGVRGLEHLLENGSEYDVVLLDVMMPGLDGWELLSRLRAGGIDTPVVFLTAKGELDERVKGLELGAADYLPKPFAFVELLARLNAVVRNRRTLPSVKVGDLVLDLATRTVQLGDRRIEVSPKEFELLATLASEPGRAFSRQELLERVWRMNFDPGTNVVQVQVARLRRKLEGPGTAPIETVVGKGYRLLDPDAGSRQT